MSKLLIETASAKTGLQAFDALSKALGSIDDLNPNSANYRYRDTGYIAGSKKELAAAMIKNSSKDGLLVRAEQIDFDALELNPREAKSLITKANLLGKIDWQAIKDSGTEPAAAFLMDKILASVPKEPLSDTPQGRRDFSIGIESLRDRLEKCKTVASVTELLDDILEEARGVVLTADESELYKELYADYLVKKLAVDKADFLLDAKEKFVRNTDNSIRIYESAIAEAKRGKSMGRKISADDAKEIIEKSGEKIYDLQQERIKQVKELEAYKSANPDIANEEDFTYSDGGKPYRPISKLAFLANDAKRKADAIKKIAERRSDNPENISQVTRSWLEFGKKFSGVLKFRYNTGSKSFQEHLYNAKKGDPADFSWAIKDEKSTTGSETETTEPKPKRTTFQLRVSDSFERTGGRQIDVKSTVELKNMFGLRDVQSGNYVLKDKSSAEFHVKHSAMAMADLADLIGVPDHLISMKGNLALAFGARGSSKALAHYESVHRIINITKNSGGGSLAHEWFHAMDNMMVEVFSGASSGVDNWLTEKPELIKNPQLSGAFAGLKAAMLTGDTVPNVTVTYTDKDYNTGVYNFKNAGNGQGIKALIRNAGNAQNAATLIYDQKHRLGKWQSWLTIAVAYHDGKPEGGSVDVEIGDRVSKFYSDALALDKGKKGAYWSKNLEMAARAFSAWCEDRQADKGQKNDYLSNHSSNDFYQEEKRYPFPTGDERTKINEAFDNLFKSIRDTNALQTILDSIYG